MRDRIDVYGAKNATAPAAKKTREAEERSAVRTALADKRTLHYIMRKIALGTSMRKIAQSLDLDYYVFHRMLRANHAETMRAAREARAEELAEKNLELADDIQEGLVEPGAGKAAAGIRQWYTERTASESWGQKSSVDVNHKGVVGLHLEAIQALTAGGEVIEDAVYSEAEDVNSSSEESDESDVDDHPLL